MHRLPPVIGAVLLISGCSSYVYKEETKLFHDSVAAAQKALQSVSSDVEKVDQEQIDKKRVNERWALRYSPACTHLKNALVQSTDRPNPPNSNSESKSASLKKSFSECQFTRAPRGDDERQTRDPLRAEALAPTILQGAAVVEQYASALVQLTTAEDEDAFRTATITLGSKFKDLTKHASESTTSSKEPNDATTPLASIVAEFTLARLNSRKLKVLRKVVNRAHPSIETVSNRIAAHERRMHSTQLEVKYNALEGAVNTDLRATLDEGKDRKDVAAAQKHAIAAFADFKAAAQAHGGGTGRFTRIAEAHEALRDAIDQDYDRRQIVPLLERLMALRSAIEEARDAIITNSNAATSTN